MSYYTLAGCFIALLRTQFGFVSVLAPYNNILVKIGFAFTSGKGSRHPESTGEQNGRLTDGTHLTPGPLSWSILIFKNSIVLHDIDQMTSVFIHLSPALVFWCLRWGGGFGPSRIETGWPGACVCATDAFLLSLVLLCLVDFPVAAPPPCCHWPLAVTGYCLRQECSTYVGTTVINCSSLTNASHNFVSGHFSPALLLLRFHSPPQVTVTVACRDRRVHHLPGHLVGVGGPPTSVLRLCMGGAVLPAGVCHICRCAFHISASTSVYECVLTVVAVPAVRALLSSPLSLLHFPLLCRQLAASTQMTSSERGKKLCLC